MRRIFKDKPLAVIFIAIGVVVLAVMAVSWLGIPGIEGLPIAGWQLFAAAVLGVIAVAAGIAQIVGVVKQLEQPRPTPPEPPAPRASNIPPSGAGVFIERPEMKHLRKTLRSKQACALVGVSGWGGVGKTTVAIQLARELEEETPGSTLWVTIGDRSLDVVLLELAKQLGTILPEGGDDELKASLLRNLLQAEPRVVFLDNVRQSFLPHLRLILPPSPPCAALVTSRHMELPGLPAGAVTPLGVMDETQALQLLRGVPGLADALQREPEEAKELARICCYHPLALDIAARRLLKHLHDSKTPLRAFNATLTNRLRALSQDQSCDPLLNLNTNLELSYEELDDIHKERWRILAVFAASGFGLPSAASLWGVEAGEAYLALERLQDACLVQPAEAEGRWKLHDLLREFAGGKLAPGEWQSACVAHADFLTKLFREHENDDPVSAPEVALELDNLVRAAGQMQALEDGFRLALLAVASHNWILETFYIWEEWRSWLEAALSLGIIDLNLKARILRYVGRVQIIQCQFPEALDNFSQSMELYRQTNSGYCAFTLASIGDLYFNQLNESEALENYQKALELARVHDFHDLEEDLKLRISLLIHWEDRGEVFDYLNDIRHDLKIGSENFFALYTGAFSLDSSMITQVLTRLRESKNQLGEAVVHMGVGFAHLDRVSAILDSRFNKRNKSRVFRVLEHLKVGDVHQIKRHCDEGLEHLDHAILFFKEKKIRLLENYCRIFHANFLLFQGKTTDAEREIDQVVAFMNEINQHKLSAYGLTMFGIHLQYLGKIKAAEPYLQRAADLFDMAGDKLKAMSARSFMEDV